MLGIIASAGSIGKTLSFIGSTTSTTSPITLPSFQVNDYMFLFISNVGTSSTAPTVPSGFTSISSLILQTSPTIYIGNRIVYKRMSSSDGLTRVVNTGSNATRITALNFRPNFTPSGTVNFDIPNVQGSTSNPTAQSVTGPSLNQHPHIIFAHYTSTGVVDPRLSSVIMNEIAGPTTGQYIKYKSYSTTDTSETISNIDMDDEGTGNILQSFFFQIQ